ncbi:MAG: 1,6-anhydro-N-acetylmuramyl-L-alanine amidase AmpD [Methylotenera sp.]|uniref:1,6-anhydro-N-acetylmuramyl-L-alanine amidase AmpD n=1 Tax=Methylotenera sp. TaxID=2051956 RepID=UPI002488BFD6|nr:1,6-anhydro-N-acetylmuramyl-L-alanine amidase AmpD [Methylotenera sp.]MDI1309194.1 1,6-anhydro-N-acetylmuramyl-L-alanine amidase AmpD [Methylotenera sp.]
MKSYTINEAGMAINAQYIASPNFDARPASKPTSKPESEISLIVIHNISLPPSQYGGNGIIELFTNQLNPDEHPYYAEIYTRKVSSHFLIRRDGELIQFVSCLDRAWHAGVSNWNNRERCNDFSVGIELEGSDFEAFEPAQYLTLKNLITSLTEAYSIQAIVGHSDIAPIRKTDPGPYFDWSQIDNINKK